MIIDCFPFHNELDILEIRLQELAEVVDWFVLVESGETYIGRPKPYLFEQYKEHFDAYNICHVRMNTLFYSNSPWHREMYTRNTLSEGLEALQAGQDDLVLLSDIDEIPRASRVAECALSLRRREKACFVFEQNLYYYYVNCRSDRKWHGTRMVRFGDFPSFHALRSMIGTIVPEGGWHFRYLGGMQRIQQQIAAAVHIEQNTLALNNPAYIATCIREKKALFEHETALKVVPVGEELPRCLLAQPHRYRSLII